VSQKYHDYTISISNEETFEADEEYIEVERETSHSRNKSTA